MVKEFCFAYFSAFPLLYLQHHYECMAFLLTPNDLMNCDYSFWCSNYPIFGEWEPLQASPWGPFDMNLLIFIKFLAFWHHIFYYSPFKLQINHLCKKREESWFFLKGWYLETIIWVIRVFTASVLFISSNFYSR